MISESLLKVLTKWDKFVFQIHDIKQEVFHWVRNTDFVMCWKRGGIGLAPAVREFYDQNGKVIRAGDEKSYNRNILSCIIPGSVFIRSFMAI